MAEIEITPNTEANPNGAQTIPQNIEGENKTVETQQTTETKKGTAHTFDLISR